MRAVRVFRPTGWEPGRLSDLRATGALIRRGRALTPSGNLVSMLPCEQPLRLLVSLAGFLRRLDRRLCGLSERGTSGATDLDSVRSRRCRLLCRRTVLGLWRVACVGRFSCLLGLAACVCGGCAGGLGGNRLNCHEKTPGNICRNTADSLTASTLRSLSIIFSLNPAGLRIA